mgnify:CR=1 FL=1
MHMLDVYLHEPELSRAKSGEMNLFNRICDALSGWEVCYHRLDLDGPVPRRPGYSLWWMVTPPVAHGLTLRRAYWFPFWRVERTNDRWNFDVARKTFPVGDIDSDAAKDFCRKLRNRIMPGFSRTSREGFLFIPLQGKLREHRSFQSMSPIDMIKETLARDSRPLRATLHPKETYEAEDISALEALARRFPRFALDTRSSELLLASCDAIVTQNSVLALSGALIGKPSILFAKIDFHHVFGSVPRDGVENAFHASQASESMLERYLFWLLQIEALNAGHPDFGARLLDRLGALGWPVEKRTAY